jgi:hypothetical protein
MHLQGNLTNVLIERNVIDGNFYYGDAFSAGIQMGDTGGTYAASYITIRGNGIKNIMDPNTGSSYWQGDGIITESHDHHILIEDNYIRRCTDGGMDIKSTDTIVRRNISEKCKRNYRLWNDNTTMFVDNISREPFNFSWDENGVRSNGAGSVRCLTTSETASHPSEIRWYGGFLDNRASRDVMMELDAGRLVMINAVFRYRSDTARKDTAGTALYHNITDVLTQPTKSDVVITRKTG